MMLYCPTESLKSNCDMKNKFYIMTALVISLTGCSNIEDGTQPTGNFPEDHIIRIVTEVNALRAHGSWK
jgi:hypothetical protein